MWADSPDTWLVRAIFLKGLAAIYLIAFVAALRQFRPLLGEQGLLPVPKFTARVRFLEAPSLFTFHYSDRFFAVVAWLGVALSTLALVGLFDALPLPLFVAVWLVLWLLYLSIVNVGQSFYGFGWESMLLEAGFFAAFLGPAHITPSIIPILILRWMLFRVELGAGLIKLRHDKCWRDLTCLFYHHETQPLPNPLSWYFHRLPRPVHRAGVLFSHFVQLICPFGLLLMQPFAAIAGAFVIIHQLSLIVSGNYAWLNWLTVVLGVTALSDSLLQPIIGVGAGPMTARPAAYDTLLYVLAGLTALLSVQPTLNLLSKNQRMNYSYNPLHLVNTYGAFGRVTRERYEVILEGTLGGATSDDSEWLAYEFKGKPGDPLRRPPQIAPYHLRLDWLMWFLPFSVVVHRGRVLIPGYELWFVRFVGKLLQGDENVAKLLRHNPFPGHPPRFIRARYYRYRFTTAEERKRTGAWWTRELTGDYLPPVSLEDRLPSDCLASPPIRARGCGESVGHPVGESVEKAP